MGNAIMKREGCGLQSSATSTRMTQYRCGCDTDGKNIPHTRKVPCSFEKFQSNDVVAEITNIRVIDFLDRNNKT